MPGAGRPKGMKNKKTVEKELIRQEFENRIIRANDALINAQIHLATGQTFLYKIEKKLFIGPKGGKKYVPQKPKLVTSQHEIESYLEGLTGNGELSDDNDPAATYYYMTTKEPNNMAIDSLQNRLHGKPKESLDLNLDVKFSLKGLAQHREAMKLKTKVIDVTEKQNG